MHYFKLISLSLFLTMGITTSVIADEVNQINSQEDWSTLQTNATQAAYAIQSDANKEPIMSAPQQLKLKQLPINTTLMTPGTQSAIDKPTIAFIQPIFIVGADDLSKSWLKQYREQLITAHAIGFLVQAQSQADIDEMKQLADGLLLIPASGNIFAQKLKLQHYPVLITKNGIEQ